MLKTLDGQRVGAVARLGLLAFGFWDSRNVEARLTGARRRALSLSFFHTFHTLHALSHCASVALRL